MQTTVTLSWFAVLAIFLVGVAFGWIMSRIRAGATFSVGIRPTDSSSSAQFRFATKTVRKVVLKCTCGAVWNFSEGGGAASADSIPFPTGDSFVCPKCGRSIDLKLERQAEADLLRNLHLPNKT